MVSDPIINPSSRALIEAVMKHAPQSLLVSGERGVGLATITRWMADKQLVGFFQPKNAKGDVDPQGTISIESIRSLYAQTRSKQASPRAYIIDDADRMSAGAQAAFLKLLEEPTPNTYFILTSHAPNVLLPTIRSRTQHIHILPATSQQTSNLIQNEYGIDDATKKAQLQFIAAGLPAEMYRLITDDTLFVTRAKIVTDARTFLQADPYAKLIIIQHYQSDRSNALYLADSALHILRRTISSTTSSSIVGQLQVLLDIRDKITAQHNIRLQLARFVV